MAGADKTGRAAFGDRSIVAELLANQLIRKIGQAAALYHRLLIVVAPAGAGKTGALREVGERTGAPLINLNLELSRRLLELTERQRALRFPRLLSEIMHSAGYDVILLDNIEILFEVSLQQDPLRLLQGLSRHKTVVAAWNGSIDKKHLIYAAPDHPEYRRYLVSDILVITPEITA